MCLLQKKKTGKPLVGLQRHKVVKTAKENKTTAPIKFISKTLAYIYSLFKTNFWRVDTCSQELLP